MEIKFCDAKGTSAPTSTDVTRSGSRWTSAAPTCETFVWKVSTGNGQLCVHDINIVQAHLVLKDKTFCCVEVCKKLVAAWQTLPDVIKL